MGNETFSAIASWLDPFFLIYFGGVNGVYFILFLLGTIRIYQRRKEIQVEDYTTLLRSESLPEVTFIMPAYNEEASIVPSIDSLLNLTYRYKWIIIVNDGSSDKTFEILKEKLKLVPIPKFYQETLPTKPIRGFYRSETHPEAFVIDKENGEKFDALNAGINACTTPYFITIDADTYISDEDFGALIRPILTSPETVAVGASVRIRNESVLDFNRVIPDRFPISFITAMQSLEYLRSFLMRQGWDLIGGNFVIAGAFSILSTPVVKEAKGFIRIVADDLEIVVRLHRWLKGTKTPYKIGYLPDPVAWTEGPSTLDELERQRIGWQRGTIEALWYHKSLFLNPKYGIFGLFVIPFLVLGEAIEPFIEIAGYIYIIVGLSLGMIGLSYVILFLCVVWGFTFLFTLFCLMIEEFSFRKYPSYRSLLLLFVYGFLENFGYRQLMLIWRIKGFLYFFKRYAIIKKLNTAVNESMKSLMRQGKFKW